MSDKLNYLEVNKASWNKKTAVHFESDFYDNANFVKGQTSLNDIEMRLLGDLKEKTVLHLQCHFGQDTISLSRLGAQAVGVDFSDKAIAKARELATITKSDARFICCDIYDLPQHLEAQFDVVFTSYGTIGWLPDMDKWAKNVSQFLKPNGKFVFAEFHPVMWIFDEQFSKIQYNYFNTEAIVESETGTYADKNAPIKQDFIMWNHPISEVLNSLIKNGLEINSLEEFDYSPYNCFNKTVKTAPKKFQIKHLKNKIPMVYSLLATKKA